MTLILCCWLSISIDISLYQHQIKAWLHKLQVDVSKSRIMIYEHGHNDITIVGTQCCDWKRDGEYIRRSYFSKYGSGHRTVAVLLPGFAINWLQNQVTRQLQFHDLTHIIIWWQKPNQEIIFMCTRLCVCVLEIQVMTFEQLSWASIH